MLGTLNPDAPHTNRPARISRCKTVSTKLTEAEFAEVERVVETRGQWLSEWAREVLLAAAREAQPQNHAALFTEIQALRLVLINALEPLLRGEQWSAEQFKQMLLYVKSNKHRVAAELMESYRGGAGE
jgi:hypothetical protein